MMRHVPPDIRQIIQSLLTHHMEVTGPTTSGEKTIYHVNGHAFSEDELRTLSQKELLSSWEVLNYARTRAARNAS